MGLELCCGSHKGESSPYVGPGKTGAEAYGEAKEVSVIQDLSERFTCLRPCYSKYGNQ